MKRGQAAFEYLTTYGWALLVIIVAGGALAYFTGFFGKVVPARCTISPPFYCAEFKVTGPQAPGQNGTVILGIQSMNGDLNAVSLSLVCGQDPGATADYAQPTLADQGRLNGTLLYLSCPVTGSPFKADFRLHYVNHDESVSHDADGFLRAYVEP